MADREDRSGFDRLGDRSGDWANRQAGKFADSKHPVLRTLGVIAVIVAVCFVISIVSGAINFGADTVHETKRVLSVQNIKEQRTAIIQDWQELLVSAGNACNAVNSPSDEGSPTMIEDPAFAYAATVRKARVDYNRRQNNLFEAQEVGPPGYPKSIPFGKKMDNAKPNWCKISAGLHRVHE
jgi:hypothetical protein